jgi:protein kinase X
MLAGSPFYDENPFGIYQNILLGKVEFSRHFDGQAKDLIRKLMHLDRSKRIGILEGGADDMQKHKWFKGMDWDAMLRKEIPPQIVPEVRHAADTKNFETYPENSVESNSGALDPSTASLFDGF